MRTGGRSILRRLVLLILLASALALACVAAAVVFYEATSYRPRAIEQLRTQSTIVGEFLRPSLDFADADSATRYVNTYRRAQPDVILAAVYDRQGRPFAHDSVEGGVIPAMSSPPGYAFDGNVLSLWQPIKRSGQVLGHLYLVQQLPPLYARLPQYLIMAGAVLLALAVVAAMLLGGVRRQVIGPLSALVDTTSRLARNEDYSVRASVARDDELGQLARSFNQMIEVVGRREAALRESEERMRRLASATFEGIVFSEEGRILELNQQAADLFGYAPDAVVGRSLVEFAAPDSRAFVESKIGNHDSGTYEAMALRRDGTRFLVEARVQPFSYQGRPASVIALRDITARKRAEADRTRLEGQLQQAQKMEAVGRLAGGVAHDFNNMLTVILGQVELALSQLDPDSPLRSGLVEVQRAGQHSADLTRQLLTFARRQTVAPKVLDLNTTVAATLSMLQRLIGEDIRLTWQPGADLWPVKVDPTQVDQVLANLSVNARDAIDGVGQVTIETRNVTFDAAWCAVHPDHRPGDFVELSLGDTGRGILPDTLEHIFEPFFTTKSPSDGTGLGLSTVFGIVTQNDGFLTVASEPKRGTCFRIYLPRVAATAVAASPARTAQAPRGQGERVLLVEDEPAILEIGRRMLESLGYTVLTAGTPSQALHAVSSCRDPIALLITDVVMPEMNGRDLAERLNRLRPDLRWLFVSGYTGTVIENRGVVEEGTSFLQKPFTLAQLATSVREALMAAA